MRFRILRLTPVFGLLGLVACVHGPVQPRSQQIAMDTATVLRLCAEPDSVLAGRGACVLRDQAAVFVRAPRQQ